VLGQLAAAGFVAHCLDAGKVRLLARAGGRRAKNDRIDAQEEPMAALCRRFGISRRVGYKWLGRYREAGVAGLEDRSRAPLGHPQAVAAAIAERCLAVRRAHPTWGPVKVRAWLRRHQPTLGWPAASTIGAVFDRAGLTVKRRLRRRCPPRTRPFAACTAANVLKAGVVPERISPGQPQQNSRAPAPPPDPQAGHREPAGAEPAPAAGALPRRPAELQRGAAARGARRHHYAMSPRAWDGVLRQPDYPDDDAVRRVRHNGEIRWRGNTVYVNQALAGEPVGLRQTDAGWTVRYGPVELGLIDHRGDRLKRPRRPARGLVDNPDGLPTTPPAQPPQR
jgi:transposase